METKALLIKTLDLIENKTGDTGGQGNHIQSVTFIDIYQMIDVISGLSNVRRGYLTSLMHKLIMMVVLNLVLIVSLLKQEVFYCTDGSRRLFLKYDWFVELLTLKTSNPLVNILGRFMKDDLLRDIHNLYSVLHGRSQVDSEFQPSNILVKFTSILVLFPLKYLSQCLLQALIVVSLITTISLGVFWAFLEQTNSAILNEIQRDISYSSTRLVYDLMKEVGLEKKSIIDYSKYNFGLARHLDHLKVMSEKLKSCEQDIQCRHTINRKAIIEFLEQEIISTKSINYQDLREVFYRNHSLDGVIRETSAIRSDK